MAEIKIVEELHGETYTYVLDIFFGEAYLGPKHRLRLDTSWDAVEEAMRWCRDNGAWCFQFLPIQYVNRV